ncbi:MAG: carbohydrate binding family 9 domain-containing protein [Vicinamibacterales bacterium]
MPDAAAQTASGSGPAADGEPTLDIRSIDHESYRAIAARLPDGQTPRIDGRLDDEVWALAPPQGNFVQREPRFGAPASERTEFRVLYDDRTIYVGVWAWDSDPGGILASELKRDSGLRKGDQIKVNFDTFHDHRNAFYFSTNPLGAYKDANSVENGRTINYDWNAVWNNRTSVDERGWYVEAAIPLSQLRFPTTIGEALWGLNVCRIILRKNEEDYWVPFPREWGRRASHACRARACSPG